jgi:hypothetical protein
MTSDRRPIGATDLLSLRDAERLTGIYRSALVEAFRSGALPRTYVYGEMKTTLRDLREWRDRDLGRRTGGRRNGKR